MTVCVLGSINWDVTAHVADLPRPGQHRRQACQPTVERVFRTINGPVTEARSIDEHLRVNAGQPQRLVEAIGCSRGPTDQATGWPMILRTSNALESS